jgi:hypothetical protein
VVYQLLESSKGFRVAGMERNSRVAPESIVSDIPDAFAVTTDFATEFYNLLAITREVIESFCE